MRSFSRSHHAVIRVYDEAGNVIQASRTQARIKQSAHFSLARARQKKARKDLKIAVNVLTKSDRNRYTSPGMRGLVRIQVIGAAAAILFARSVVADDWPYYQHDVWHTGDSSGFVNPQALSLTWTAPSSPTGYSTPVIVGNNIYAMQNQQGIGGSHTTVSSFDLSTGTINWSYTGEFVFPSQPGVGGGFVTFVGSTISSSALYVLDAITGTLRYTVPIPEGFTSMMPTVVQDQISGNVTAFVADGSQVSAVSLGTVSGLVLWTQIGSFGGQSIPTVVGSSIVLAGPGQYYAFDQATGAANHFWSGGTTDPKYASFTDPKGPSGAEASWAFLKRYRKSDTAMPCAEAPAPVAAVRATCPARTVTLTLARGARVRSVLASVAGRRVRTTIRGRRVTLRLPSGRKTAVRLVLRVRRQGRSRAQVVRRTFARC